MGENSKIEWCHHTFNIVWGCVKVDQECAHCYAEAWAKRTGHDVFGPAKTTERRVMSDAYWKQPHAWNRAAERSGQRARVFCSSMADVFEDHPTNAEQRPRLWDTITATPWLDWLLLTKRPENIRAMLPYDWAPYPNVWLGTSVGYQESALKRVPHLFGLPAVVRFLSCEPLLGPLDLGFAGAYIDWVICGGESGPGARPMHPDWARSLRDQCAFAGVRFFFKQWGQFGIEEIRAGGDLGGDLRRGIVQHVRADRENDGHYHRGDVYMRNIGKKMAGRILDGRTWDEMPEATRI